MTKFLATISKNTWSQLWSFIYSNFKTVFSVLDNVTFWDSFSLLDIFIALTVVGAVLPIVIITVNNWSESGADRLYESKNYKRSKTPEYQAAKAKVKEAYKKY